MEKLTRFFALLALLTVFCVNSLWSYEPLRTDTIYRIRKDVYREYRENARRLLDRRVNVSFSMRHTYITESGSFENVNTVYLGIRDGTRWLAAESAYSCLHMTKREINYISHVNQDIYTLRKRMGGQYNSVGMLDYVNSVFDEIPYYVMAAGNNGWFLSGMDFIDKYDTVINGMAYDVYVALRVSFQSNGATKPDTRLLTMIKSFFNTETGFIDSVSSVGVNHNRKTYVNIENACFDDMTAHCDSVFDVGSMRYGNYSRHNNVPATRELSVEGGDRITRNVLNYALISPNGDTTSISRHEGYVLLEFWTFNCASCIRHFEKYKDEKEESGKTRIERLGIKTMAINYKSNNMEMIRSIGDKYGVNDILYSGKGMDSEIQFPYQGNFILLSPDRKIIYENPVLEDYNVLVEAKKKYEESKK